MCAGFINKLQEENQSLRQKLSASQAANYQLQKKVAHLKKILCRSSVNKFCTKTAADSSIPGLFKFYTGFTYLTFICIFNILVPLPASSLPFKFSRKLSSITKVSPQDQLFIVLSRLRCAFTFKDLSFRCGISAQDLSVMCSSWINYIYFTFGSVSIWPHRDIICSKMPPKFKSEFPDTIAIIDATEIRLQRPSSLLRQSQCFSDYKSTNTFKGLIAVDPRGSVIFISPIFSGSISDNRLTHESGLLKLLGDLRAAGHLKEGDSIMADKGFTNFQDFAKLGLKLNVPPFASGQGQMCAGDVVSTRIIAAHRVHVERAIARIKNFKIVSNQTCISSCSIINQIWFVCAFLTNFQPFLIKE